MDEKKTIELEVAKSQLTSSSSERKKTSLSHHNWKRMRTTAKASFLKKVSLKELQQVRKGVGRRGSPLAPLSHKKRVPEKEIPEAPDTSGTGRGAGRGDTRESNPLSSKRKGGLRSRLGRRLIVEASRMAEDLLAQDEEQEELVKLKQGVQKGRLSLHRVQTSLGYVHSTLSKVTKAQSLSASYKRDKARKKKRRGGLLFKKAFRSKTSKSSVWNLAVRPVRVVFSSIALKWGAWALGGFFLLLLLMASVFGQMFPIQSEYDLNETYLYMTQLDRKKSSDTVEYYTNWEDPLLYLHFHYEAIHEDPR
ncbi:hypothetical protein E4T82_11670, partial [Streptococcus cuniculi]